MSFEDRLQPPEPTLPSGYPVSPDQPTTDFPNLPSPVENSSWDLLDVILTIAFAVVCFIFVGGLVIGIAHSLSRFHKVPLEDLSSNALIVLPIQLLASVLTIIFMAQIVWARHGTSLMAGIAWGVPARRTVLAGIVGGFCLAIVSQIVGSLLSRWAPSSVPFEEMFQKPLSAYAFSFYAVFFAPPIEELFFRGFMFPALARRLGVPFAIGLTALAFTLLHSAQYANSWAVLVPILIVGLVLTVIRAALRSVALSMVVHSAYNATVLTMVIITTHGFHQIPHA